MSGDELPDHLDTGTCDHCGGDYTYDVTHTGEIHCPHCRRRVKVQIGRAL